MMCKGTQVRYQPGCFADEGQITDLKRFGFCSQLVSARTAESPAESIRHFAGSPAANTAAAKGTRD